MSDYSYLGAGKILVRVKDSAAPLVELGNCSALSLAVAEQTIELRDSTQPGGGTYNEVRRVQSVEAAITMHDLSPANLARALFGGTASGAATAITAESAVAYAGGYTKLARRAVSIQSVEPVGGGTPYTVDDDYELRDGMLYIPTGSSITAPSGGAANVEVDYTPELSDLVDALVNSAQEYEMVFAGLNEARSGKAVTVHLYRVKLGAAANLALIGEEFAALEQTGKCLKDTSKTGAGVSQYFKVEVAQ